MAEGVAGHDLCRVAAGRAPTLSATVHVEIHPRGKRPGFNLIPGLFFLFRMHRIGRDERRPKPTAEGLQL